MIYDEDWEFLSGLYGRQVGPQAIGTSAAIRALVHKFCRGVRARAEAARDGAAEAGANMTDQQLEDNDDDT
jgi:hypothetical protein